MTEILGHCKDCYWLVQEYHYISDDKVELDHYCRLSDLFKSPNRGYCDLWEPNE